VLGRARAHYLWLSPSKVRRVLPHIKRRPVQDAIDILTHISHRSSVQLQKLIKSARANYLQKFPTADQSTLYVKNIYVDEGPRIKRLWRRGRGRADILLKRMCHITAFVATREDVAKPKSAIASWNRGTSSAKRPRSEKANPSRQSLPEKSARTEDTSPAPSEDVVSEAKNVQDDAPSDDINKKDSEQNE